MADDARNVPNELQSEFASVSADFKKFQERMRDPLVVGAMLAKLSDERSSTNLLLREINAKLDRFAAFEERLARMEARFEEAGKTVVAAAGSNVQEARGGVLLAEIDEGILAFVKKRSKASAEDVQKEFQYKGRNAASSRLNRLCDQGILEKRQVGRKVYFIAR